MRTSRWAALLGAGALLWLTPGGHAAQPELGEPSTGVAFPGEVVVRDGDTPRRLVGTGIGLRESLGMDVYVVAAYFDPAEAAEPGFDPAAAVGARRLVLYWLHEIDMHRFRKNLRKVARRNTPDTEDWEPGFHDILALLDSNPRDGDRLAFTWLPDSGLLVEWNRRGLGLVESPSTARALWGVWFGPEPTDKKLRDRLAVRLEDAPR